jgi:hypothetical protein
MTACPISHESRRGPERVAVVLMLVVVAVLLVAGVVPRLAGADGGRAPELGDAGEGMTVSQISP